MLVVVLFSFSFVCLCYIHRRTCLADATTQVDESSAQYPEFRRQFLHGGYAGEHVLAHIYIYIYIYITFLANLRLFRLDFAVMKGMKLSKAQFDYIKTVWQGGSVLPIRTFPRHIIVIPRQIIAIPYHNRNPPRKLTLACDFLLAAHGQQSRHKTQAGEVRQPHYPPSHPFNITEGFAGDVDDTKIDPIHCRHIWPRQIRSRPGCRFAQDLPSLARGISHSPPHFVHTCIHDTPIK